VFTAGVVAALVLDLGIGGRASRPVSPRQALVASAGFVALAIGFAGFLWARAGARPALDFLAGYVVEKALSVDNVFFILVTLTSFRVPEAHFRRVLTLGIFGALVMRGALILAGASLIRHVHAATYVLGAILVVTAVRLLVSGDEAPAPPDRSPVVRLCRRVFPVTPDHEEGRFFVRRGGRWHVTPLLLALLAVEVGDVVFAADSIPAVLAITADPFLVFTSNVLAILGLRSLFFALRGLLDRFHYLEGGVALILLFIGAKMLLALVFPISTAASLAVIGVVLAGALGASVWRAEALGRKGAAS
jgi:tellurite resistance protein TerC